jgi:hypothetical protein
MWQLREELRGHELDDVLDRYRGDRVPQIEQRLDALDTWWRFANGDSIDVNRLGELVDVLANVADDHGEHRWLADTVERHCLDAGTHLPTPETETHPVEPSGVDVEL